MTAAAAARTEVEVVRDPFFVVRDPHRGSKLSVMMKFDFGPLIRDVQNGEPGIDVEDAVDLIVRQARSMVRNELERGRAKVPGHP